LLCELQIVKTVKSNKKYYSRGGLSKMYNKTVTVPKLTNMDFFFIAYYPFSHMHMDFHVEVLKGIEDQSLIFCV
jgi:hypothetical protein